MSETDSFIEEVTEEVRRERLFGYMRRYGWIAILLVVLLVAGAAYNEYSKAQTLAQTEARGDALLAALDSEDAGAALSELKDLGAAEPVAAMLRAAAAMEGEDPAAAATALSEVINNPEAPVLYRDMALLKHMMLTASDTDPETRIAALEAIAAPGAPFRVLAEEQIALAEIEKGDIEAALNRLRALAQDTEATQGLRVRAQQLIVALGGEPEPA